jgi:AraC-like DNA-binding protein
VRDRAPAYPLVWDGRFFRARPGLAFAPSPSRLTTFFLAIDGILSVSATDRPVCAPTRSVLLAPAAAARVTSDALVACLYLEPGASEVRGLTSQMTPLSAHLWVDHAQSERFASGLADIVHQRTGAEETAERMAAALGLSATRIGDSRIAFATDLITADPSLAHRADTLARCFGMSESRFRHAFRTATGLSLTRYRMLARLRAAMVIAGEGGSLTEAALEAGFSSSAHFSSSHRAMFGLSPSGALAARPERPSRTSHGS